MQAYFASEGVRKMCASIQLDTQSLPSYTAAEIHQKVAEAVTRRNPAGGLMLYMYVSDETPLANIEALCCAEEEECLF